MDFSQVKIHCSSLGCLFTEPQSKADKEAGKLSKTAQAHLVKSKLSRWRRGKNKSGRLLN
jgi:hypothetical protein